MTSSTTTSGSARSVFFAALLDDAALFPPGNAPMREALTAYADHRLAPYAPLVGPFVCSADRLDELVAELPEDLTLLDVAVVVRDGAAGVPAAVEVLGDHDRLRLAAVEVAGPVAECVAALDGCLPESARGFVEVAVRDLDALDRLASTPYAAKLRTGGTSPSAFPTEAELAAAIARCAGLGLPFKCTAGLHEALRHTDEETGFEHHGFLNVMAAVHAALTGGDVAETLARREAAMLALALRELPQEALSDVRRLFLSFGTCSVREPVDDLTALGLVHFL